ncbi:MAG: 6,7-dimethyl-8-ribityllumazine synthase [Candidatus Eremiobacteraeota bacterium]|nr:6,7-dimethyl-8-ribityllumazine synthase [Candidatus Eremiobacteraeota bacterium]MBV8365210.1 6,7-dimethyl-8-ribityllumazine synthase [Candidatus Eremiobacteraeota bacterium]
MRFAVVRSRFNAPITQALFEGAMRGFADARIEPDLIESFEVPGSFELPLAALWLAETKKYNAIVCLGCVIRGQTPHFEHVAREAARGVADVALRTRVPVIFGVLTTDTLEQALARAEVGAGRTAGHGGEGRPADAERSARSNKGYEAALSAVDMAQLRKKFDI